jgi:hypothetical protein
MSLRECRDCGAIISPRADLCVHCGISYPTFPAIVRSLVRTTVLIGFTALAVGTYIGTQIPSSATEVEHHPRTRAEQDRPDAAPESSGVPVTHVEPVAEAVTPGVVATESNARRKATANEWVNVRARGTTASGTVTTLAPREPIWVDARAGEGWIPVYRSESASTRLGYVYRDLITVQ